MAFLFKVRGPEVPDDAEMLILDWCGWMDVPEWDKKATNCLHCKVALKSGHNHNCRLCGFLVCSACSGKYHVPDKFEPKKGKAVSRVCLKCKNTCVKARDKSQGKHVSSRERVIMPPEWQEEKDYAHCMKCRVNENSHHNCRICGLFYCDNCSCKMELGVALPAAFNKKAKAGAQRVCDECRFKVLTGYTLHDPDAKEDESKSAAATMSQMAQALTVPTMMNDRKASVSTMGVPGQRVMSTVNRSGNSLIVPGMGMGSSSSGSNTLVVPGSGGRLMSVGGRQMSTVNGRMMSTVVRVAQADDMVITTPDGGSIMVPKGSVVCKAPTAEQQAAASQQMLQISYNTVTLLVKQEGRAMPLTSLDVMEDVDVREIHEALMTKVKELREKKLCYLCREQPVHEAHWDIFKARNFDEEIVFREVGTVALTRKQIDPSTYKVAASADMDFKAKAKEALDKRKAEEEEKMAKEHSEKFHKPKKLQRQEEEKAVGRAPPPPPPMVKKVAAASQEGTDEVFAARARNLFGGL